MNSVVVTSKPFSQACENNKGPILEVLQHAFADTTDVLEIGSGTGQHAIWFAQHLPHLQWQPSDRADNIPGMELWFEEIRLANLKPPVELDVTQSVWPVAEVSAVFTANTLHIMGWPEVTRLFERLSQILAKNGKLCVYGPFNYGGAYTSDSNARFDQWLAQQNPHSAIRDFEQVDTLAERVGLQLVADHEMPANNRLLEWQRHND